MINKSLEQWRCGNVILRSDKGQSLTCGSGLVEWIPVALIHCHGEEGSAVLGALMMCSPCKLRFKFADLDSNPIWQGMKRAWKERHGTVPTARHVDVEWLSIHDFLKSQEY